MALPSKTLAVIIYSSQRGHQALMIAGRRSAHLLRSLVHDLMESYKVVGAISDGSVVVSEYLRLRPDVIILDISMGDRSGIDIAYELRDSGCRAKVIFLTVHEDADYVNAGMGAGGSAYVVKSRLGQDLLSAIKAVLSNKLFVSPTLLY